MNGTRITAIRFATQRYRSQANQHGFGSNLLGRIDTVHDDEAIRQALLLLLSTRPGERVMRPEYGCDLEVLLFQPVNGATAGMAIHYVRRAITLWEPRVEILSLDAYPCIDRDGCLEVALTYRVRATGHVDSLALNLDMAGSRVL